MLLQVDLDEFVNVSHARAPELARQLLSVSQFCFPRFIVHCATCPSDQELWRTPFAGNVWKKAPELWGPTDFSVKARTHSAGSLRSDLRFCIPRTHTTLTAVRI